MSPPDDEEDYFLPLEDQRVFGAGISRKRVPFVRSSDVQLTTLPSSSSSSSTSNNPSGTSIADKYLSIVMPKPPSTSTPTSTHTDTDTDIDTSKPETKHNTSTAPPQPTCEICNLPVLPTTEDDTVAEGNTPPTRSKPHEASLAHQVCLVHSRPPSHLDRSRHGLRYLASYGWDPDSRVGLGAPGREGIREPLKGKVKADTVGLGAGIFDDDEEDSGGKGKGKGKGKVVGKSERNKEKVRKLNAKEVRMGHLEARRRGEKLREMFYRDNEVLKYLGEG